MKEEIYENDVIFKAYSKLLLRDLSRIEKSLENEDIEGALSIVRELKEDTISDIQTK